MIQEIRNKIEITIYILYSRLGNNRMCFNILHDDAIQIYFYPSSVELGSYVLKRDFQEVISAIVTSV